MAHGFAVEERDHGNLDGLSDNDHTQYLLGEDWQDYTPTLTNITVGNGTQVARYQKVGNTIHVRYHLTWGSTTSFAGTPLVSSPVSAAANYPAFTTVGVAHFRDATGSVHASLVRLDDVDTFRAVVASENGTSITHGNPNATTPFTWTTGDVYSFEARFEAA